MDEFTVEYIFTYYQHLFSSEEEMAVKHYTSLSKLEDNCDLNRLNVYKKMGWITSDPNVLKLLENGYEHFVRQTALRIFRDYSSEIYLNKCKQCNELARTPLAKQCRLCGHSWRV